MKGIVWVTLGAVALGCLPVVSAIPNHSDFLFASTTEWTNLQFACDSSRPYRPNLPFLGRYNGSRFFSGEADLAKLIAETRADLQNRRFKEDHRKGRTIFRFEGEEITFACLPTDPHWVTVTHEWTGTSGLLTR